MHGEDVSIIGSECTFLDRIAEELCLVEEGHVFELRLWCDLIEVPLVL